MNKIIINIVDNKGFVLHLYKNKVIKNYTINASQLTEFRSILNKLGKFKLYFFLNIDLNSQTFVSNERLLNSANLKSWNYINSTENNYQLTTKINLPFTLFLQDTIEVNATLPAAWMQLADEYLSHFQGLFFTFLNFSILSTVLLNSQVEEGWEIFFTNDYENHFTLILFKNRTIFRVKEFYIDYSEKIKISQQIMEILYELKKEILFQSPLARPTILLILPPLLKQIMIQVYNFVENSTFILTPYEAAVNLNIEQNLKITYLESYSQALVLYNILKEKNTSPYFTPIQNYQKTIKKQNMFANLCLVNLFLLMLVYSGWLHFKINNYYKAYNELTTQRNEHLENWNQLNTQFIDYDKKIQEKIKIYKVFFTGANYAIQDIYNLQGYINISHLEWACDSGNTEDYNDSKTFINVEGESKITELPLYQTLRQKFTHHEIFIKSYENKKAVIFLKS